VIERIIYDKLNEDLQYYKDDSRRLVEFLTKHHGLAEEEAEKARIYFDRNPDIGEDGGPPNIIHGYPRQSGPFPCWAIVLAGDSLKQRFLGDDTGFEYIDDEGEEQEIEDMDGQLAEGRGSWEDVRIDVHTYVQWIPDIGLYYYHLLRSILINSVGDFINKGMTLSNFGGRDLVPDDRYMPKDIWIRVLSLTFEKQLEGWAPRGEGKVLSGAHYDDGTDDELTRNITPYVEE
jgi:hypothetical protein